MPPTTDNKHTAYSTTARRIAGRFCRYNRPNVLRERTTFALETYTGNKGEVEL